MAVVGNVDAGKSTLLGVLTHGELDNGRGFARMKLFRHKHEMETGRTSSVGNDILGFDSQGKLAEASASDFFYKHCHFLGKVVNKPDHGHLDWIKICEDSSKVITFIDLAGHERYLKTTVFGMTGHLPDFTMLMVSTGDIFFIYLIDPKFLGWSKCWSYRNDQRTLGVGTGSQCASICCSNKNRYVSS